MVNCLNAPAYSKHKAYTQQYWINKEPNPYTMNDATNIYNLPNGSQVDRYVIEKKLGGGGFSIVYLAKDTESGDRVVIKEYMPRKLAHRCDDGLSVCCNDDKSKENFDHGRKLFFQEAKILNEVKHHNIVQVLSLFPVNGTVYMIMAYEQGINLQDYIRRHDGSLSEALIRTVFVPLLKGLKVIHEHNMLHLDIKPGNIYLRKGADPILLDFGAVHMMQTSRKYQPAQVITQGFSPHEQSTMGGYVGPWTDLYAIGATMRACIEGIAPPPCDERRNNDKMKPAAAAFKKDYSKGLLKAIDWAMEVDPMLRPQNVDQLLEALAIDEPPPAKTQNNESESVFERIANSLPWTKR